MNREYNPDDPMSRVLGEFKYYKSVTIKVDGVKLQVTKL